MGLEAGILAQSLLLWDGWRPETFNNVPTTQPNRKLLVVVALVPGRCHEVRYESKKGDVEPARSCPICHMHACVPPPRVWE